jgi:hypothetical protein
VKLGPITAISAMVAPVVLITVGGVLVAGILNAYGFVADRLFRLTRERVGILGGPEGELLDRATVPPVDRERLTEIDAELPMVLRRIRRLRDTAGALYCALAFLVAGVILIGVAVTSGSLTWAYAALALVLAGTVTLFAAVALAAGMLIQSTDAATYEARRTRRLG